MKNGDISIEVFLYIILFYLFEQNSYEIQPISQ